jgi:GNAT superfamily N-acetyltransferase
LTAAVSAQAAIAKLSRDPLRNVVLLKQLLAYPRHVKVHRVCGRQGVATLVAVEASVSAYDRVAYPKADVVAFIESDHPELTALLACHVPRGAGVVFKLSREADLAPIESRFPVIRRTAFVSFTSAGASAPDPQVRIVSVPADDAFELFRTQGHEREWLQPLLGNGKAFACVLERDGHTDSACVAFENYGPVWEVGGVVTAPAHRRKGLGVRVVRTALSELTRRSLAPRYQVEEGNTASIRLAQSVGLEPFLTIVHYAHAC